MPGLFSGANIWLGILDVHDVIVTGGNNGHD
jgi:hypothetical protein